MPRRILKRKKTGSAAKGNSRPSEGQPFRVVFIRMSGPLRDPTVRVLVVETAGARAVYEGMEPWSKCKDWMKQLRGITNPKDKLAEVCKTFKRMQFATIQEAQASLKDLESLGLRRADR